MTNRNIKRGMAFVCIKSLGEWFTKGKIYVSLNNCTIRDNSGFDYDVLHVDEYFDLIS